MIALVVVLLCLGCSPFPPQATLAAHVRQGGDPFYSRLGESSVKPREEYPDDDLPSSAVSSAPWLTAEREDPPTAGGEFDEAEKSSSPQPPPSNRRHRRRHNRLLQQRPTYGGGSGKESRMYPFYRRFFNRRPAQGAKREGVRRFQPERHERCDEDLDCRRSPSQVCVKRAHEPFGRCQCPYYRPVEVTVDGVFRCATARDLFDECHVTEECAAANPYLRCIHNLCVCAAPYVLRDKKDCQPVNDIWQWISWLAPVLVTAVVSATSIACFVSKRRRATGSIQPAADQPSSVGHVAAAAAPPPYAASSWLPAREPCTASGVVGRREAILTRLRIPSIDYGRLREWTRLYKKAGRAADVGSESADFHEVGGAPAQHHAPILWAKRAFRLLPSPLYQGKLLQRLKSQPWQRGGMASGGEPPSPLAFLRKCTAGARRLAGAPQEATRTPSDAAVRPVEQQSSLPFTPLQATHDSQSSEPAGPLLAAALAYYRRPESPQPLARSDEAEASSFQSFPMAETPCALQADALEDILRRLRRINAGGLGSAGDDVRSSGRSDEEPPRIVRRVTFADY